MKEISLETAFEYGKSEHTYSRISQPVTSYLESELATMHHGHAVVYGSGMSALLALMFLYRPKTVLFCGGYQGTDALFAELFPHIILKKLQVQDFDGSCIWEDGDLVLVECPLNSTGELVDLHRISELKRAVKGVSWLVLDATLAPFPCQNFLNDFASVDMVMHSTTKYYGGHGDLLGGLLLTRNVDVATRLRVQRKLLGCVMGSFEAYLLLRSLKTSEMRVLRQSETCVALIRRLVQLKHPSLTRIFHTSQSHQSRQLHQRQMKHHSPVFWITCRSEQEVEGVLDRLKVFRKATSFGSVDSSVDYRRWHFDTADPLLLRFSVGLEPVEVLFKDIRDALTQSARL